MKKLLLNFGMATKIIIILNMFVIILIYKFFVLVGIYTYLKGNREIKRYSIIIELLFQLKDFIEI